MKNLLVAACCALASVPSFAGDWAFVSADANRADFADVSSKVQNGNVVGMWILGVLRESSAKEDHALAWYEIDCKQKRFRAPQVVMFGKEGKIESEFKSNEWTRPLPDSRASITITRVCNKDLTVLFPNANPTMMSKAIRASFKQTKRWK